MSKVILKEIINFLKHERTDLKVTACTTVSQLTGTKDGLELILEEEPLLVALIGLVCDSNHSVAEEAAKVLVNISSTEEGSKALISLSGIDIVEILLKCITNLDGMSAHTACDVLSNLTRFPALCHAVLEKLGSSSVKLEGLVEAVCRTEINRRGGALHGLARVLANLTQSHAARREILNPDKLLFERLIPFIEFPDSKVKRHMILSTVHNCCFEKNCHEWMLSDHIDLASRLVLPLCGPDAFTQEENDSLPLDLQYLPDTKLREEFPELRALILESLMLLCTTRKSRERLRELNVYIALREYHKWEKDEKCITLCEDVVNFLIRTEEEIGEDDLSMVQVPQDLSKKFVDFDKQN